MIAVVSDAPERDAARLDVVPQDVEGFYRAVEPHVEKMSRVAARLGGVGERDDVVQAALLNAWRHRDQFDPSRGSLSAWLMAITRHEAQRMSRRLGRFIRPNSEVRDDTSADLIDLHEGIKRLSVRQRLAVDCYYVAGLTVGETATVMGCSEGTVKSTLADGRAQLRVSLR